MSKNVLIVDDDPDTRQLVSSAVSMLEFTPHEAGNGEDGMAVFAKVNPDLVILDVMMPGISGIEVCRKIKSTQGGELIPIIMLTARDGVQDKVVALEGGADDYLTKPFHFQELQARLKALLRVRELNLSLLEKNRELQSMQEKLVQQERQLLVAQFAGTAAHSLGQPLAAIVLNCHLLENIQPDDPKYKKAIAAIKLDAKRMAEMIEKLKLADAAKTTSYYGETEILDLEKKK